MVPMPSRPAATPLTAQPLDVRREGRGGPSVGFGLAVARSERTGLRVVTVVITALLPVRVVRPRRAT